MSGPDRDEGHPPMDPELRAALDDLDQPHPAVSALLSALARVCVERGIPAPDYTSDDPFADLVVEERHHRWAAAVVAEVTAEAQAQGVPDPLGGRTDVTIPEFCDAAAVLGVPAYVLARRAEEGQR